MKQFIKVCESRYGTRTCIYRYVNPNQIIEFHIEQTQNKINLEATLTNNERVIICNSEDVKSLLGCENAKELFDEIYEKLEEKNNKKKNI